MIGLMIIKFPFMTYLRKGSLFPKLQLPLLHAELTLEMKAPKDHNTIIMREVRRAINSWWSDILRVSKVPSM